MNVCMYVCMYVCTHTSSPQTSHLVVWRFREFPLPRFYDKFAAYERTVLTFVLMIRLFAIYFATVSNSDFGGSSGRINIKM
jgi:hypothetical protein